MLVSSLFYWRKPHVSLFATYTSTFGWITSIKDCRVLRRIIHIRPRCFLVPCRISTCPARSPGPTGIPFRTARCMVDFYHELLFRPVVSCGRSLISTLLIKSPHRVARATCYWLSHLDKSATWGSMSLIRHEAYASHCTLSLVDLQRSFQSTRQGYLVRRFPRPGWRLVPSTSRRPRVVAVRVHWSRGVSCQKGG